jgi:alpha-1,2-mannosyltransferase
MNRHTSHAGGGGERVLWTIIASLQRQEPHIVCVVYTGDVGVAPAEILMKVKVSHWLKSCTVIVPTCHPVKSRFNIELSPSNLHFVFLRSRHLVENTAWPRFTLAGQSFGSMYLVWEAIHELIPDIYIGELLMPSNLELINLIFPTRYNGLCVHVPCCVLVCWYTCWCLHPLSDHQHGHDLPGQNKNKMAY